MSKYKTLFKGFILASAFAFSASMLNPIAAHATEPEGEDIENVEENTEEAAEVIEEPSKEIDISNYVVNVPVTNNIYLSVFTDYEWYNSHYAIAHVLVSDLSNSGWEPKSISAKIGKDGNWIDITADKTVVLSENVSLYVSIKDAEGNIYDKSVKITCFDYEAPELNAAISDGVLSVQPVDDLSGIDSIYVNGYQFTSDSFIRGGLSIRLQQFDASYPYFLVQAIDKAGNLSKVYKFENPYCLNPNAESDYNPAEQLPISALPSNVSSATGEVLDHVETDLEGEALPITHTSDVGRSFYTIQTESGKIFYLIVSRDGQEEQVHFLTDIDENDLLNTLDENSDVLPMNSAATTNQTNTNNVKNTTTTTTTGTVASSTANNGESVQLDMTPDDLAEEEAASEAEQAEKDAAASSDSTSNLIIIIGLVIFGIVAYFLKVKKPKQRKMTDEAISEEEDEEIPMEDE